MKELLIFFVLLMAGLSAGAQLPLTVPASAKQAVVYHVHDGDSYFLVDSTRRDSLGKLWRFKIRMYGIDAPEVYAPKYSVDQPYGREAGNQVRDWLKGRRVWYDSLSTDPYGTMVARLYLSEPSADSSGVHVITDVGAWCVALGIAWAWIDKPRKKRTDYEKSLIALQGFAASEKRGLWSVSGRKIRPANWRKKNMGQ